MSKTQTPSGCSGRAFREFGLDPHLLMYLHANTVVSHNTVCGNGTHSMKELFITIRITYSSLYTLQWGKGGDTVPG